MNSQPEFCDFKGNLYPKPRSLKFKRWREVLAFGLFLFAFASFAAVTQMDLASQVKGILPVANGGTGSSSAQIPCSIVPALTGDTTSSAGSCATTTSKVNGTSVPTNSAADQLLATTSSATGAWATIPNCPSGALQYTTAMHSFACGTVLTGSFADAEVPTGAINGSNTTFTLAHTPSPAGSLSCYLNGLQQRAGGADFTLATATITYGTAPATGATLICFYRF